MGMPVNNHIKAIGDCGLDNGFHAADIAIGVFQETPVILRPHSDTHNTRIPIFSEGLNGPRRIKAILPPPRIGPGKARPGERGDLPV